MSFLKLAIRGLLYHWRINATVALGVAAATAVLTGALVVGDSVRGSLRAMTLDRLGRIEQLLMSDHFFEESLVDRLRQQPGFQQYYGQAVGVMLFPQATVQRPGEAGTTRASNVLVVGSGPFAEASSSAGFWDLGDPSFAPARSPAAGEIILNRQLADELAVMVGDKVTLRLPRPENIPADSPLGEKTDRIRSLPGLTVIEILENRSLGRFSIHPSQSEPRNAFVALRQLQSALDQAGRINTILVGGLAAGLADDPSSSEKANEALAAALHPSFDDLGLNVKHARLTHTDPASGQEEVIYDYFSLSSDRMIMPPAVERAAGQALSEYGGQSVLTYLANLIEPAHQGDRPATARIPYSMVAAIDPSADFQLRDPRQQPIGPLADDEIILTSWAAEDLSIGPGDQVRLTYFQPETEHGTSQESHVVLQVKAVTPLTPPAEPYLPSHEHHFTEPPTIANDPDMTPEVEGITDQRSIDNWEVPFTVDYSLIRSQDDEYWEQYATTPKAYVSLATGRRLWGSRFGQSTSYRVAARGDLTREQFEQLLLGELSREKAALGLVFEPIRQLQVEASAGNTPFDFLFLLLSFFIIAAALMLVALLLRLGFEQRATQAGVLLAVGWGQHRLRRLLLAEGLGIAIIGSGLGIMIGLGYAALLLTALQSEVWWLGAIATPFLEFHYSAFSLVIGYLAGVTVSALTIYWSVFRIRRVPARQLLSGSVSSDQTLYARRSRWPNVVALLLVILSLALAFSARRMSGMEQAGWFVGSGALILLALLLGIWNALRQGGRSLAPLTGRAPLAMLAARSAARNPTRSVLTIGLIATASFLIVAMSAFRLTPTESGTGGFDLMAELSQPIFADFTNQAQREDLLGDAASVVSDSVVYTFRVRPGDDASCGNLYQAQQPRILGVPPAFVRHFDQANTAGFAFAASGATEDSQRRNPWHLLPMTATGPGEPIPVVLDKDTAMYSLKLYGGIGQKFTFIYDDQPVEFRVVGLLSLSVLHGNLLISSADFRQLFPQLSGYRFALLKTPRSKVQQVAEVLEDRLDDQGFDARETIVVLDGLMALQNTYLRTFQMLGALGLLLGTFGLAAVQLRSVLERRGEMGLLRAAGFRRRRLVRLVLLENVFLLLVGLGGGVVAALVAVLPHMWGGGATVPFVELAVMLAIVLLAGLASGFLAARATLRVRVLAALREER